MTSGSLLGNAVRRVEDPEVLLGRAAFVDDLDLPGVLHLVFVRSTVAHADLLSIDVAEAAAQPGVAGVFTGTDLDLPVAPGLMVVNPEFARPPLAKERVRFVGDMIAVVAAETRAAAVDAAELVVVDYEPLPAAVDLEAATEPGAPVQFEAVGSNVASGSREAGDDDPLAGADVVVRGRFENQRMAVLPMEGNAVAVVPGDDGAGHDLTVYVATQSGSSPPTSAAPSAARPAWPRSTPWRWPSPAGSSGR
jgi:aerobic carbon-monoxide dehydrogenase large subunit